jgi:DNA-binding MarR family transcriptional regulator
MNEEVLNEKPEEQKSTIASIVKRTNAMKILMYISTNIDGFESYTLQEVAEPLEMNENTAYKNLNKLVEIGLLEKTVPKGNKKERYYEIIDKILAKKAIEKYKHWVGFCLARLVPYERLYASQLKQNKHFIEACAQYGFSIDEGLNAIYGCYKIEKEFDGTEVIINRKEQGYDA